MIAGAAGVIGLVLAMVPACSGTPASSAEPQAAWSESDQPEARAIVADAGPVDAQPAVDAAPPAPQVRGWECHESLLKRGSKIKLVWCFRSVQKCMTSTSEHIDHGLLLSICYPVPYAYCYTVSNELEQYAYTRCFMKYSDCDFHSRWFLHHELDVVSKCEPRE